MAKKALVILAEGFEEIEAISCIDILRRAEIEVTVAALTALKVKGSRGVWVIADKLLNELGSDFDCLVLPGGSLGATNLASSELVTSLIQKMFRQGKIIAAICASPAVVLAPTGILENKTATCYPGMQRLFGPNTHYKDEAVVVDGTVITSKGPATAIGLALSIVEKLCGRQTKDELARSILAG